MRSLSLVFMLITSIGVSSTAHAETSTILLGLRSIDGDDEFANAMTEALRDQASQMNLWKLSTKKVSLSQISLAYGCEELDVACLVSISKGLNASSIIYGTIRRTSALEPYNLSVTLNLFSAATSAIENTIAETLSSTMSADAQSLGPKAMMMLQKLSNTYKQTGILIINSNHDVVDVQVDEIPRGQTENGRLSIESLSPGKHKIEVSKQGFQTYRETVNITEGTETYLQAILSIEDGSDGNDQPLYEPSSSSGSDNTQQWIGWTLVGVSGISLVGLVVSWAWIQSIDDDEKVQEYRERVGNLNPNATDICLEAQQGNLYPQSGTGGTPEERAKLQDIQDMCDRADVLEVLQYVFLGTAVVSGGLGAYLLLSSSDSDSDQREATISSVSLLPHIGPSSTGATVYLRF